jgi:hypothetical protein
MRLSTGIAEAAGLRPYQGIRLPLPDDTLAAIRRRARIAIFCLWLGFAASLFVLPEDAVLAIAVLLAGISTVLESVHGARAFDRLWRRIPPRR